MSVIGRFKKISFEKLGGKFCRPYYKIKVIQLYQLPACLPFTVRCYCVLFVLVLFYFNKKSSSSRKAIILNKPIKYKTLYQPEHTALTTASFMLLIHLCTELHLSFIGIR